MERAQETLYEMLKLRGFNSIKKIESDDEKNPNSLTAFNEHSEIIVHFEIQKSSHNHKKIFSKDKPNTTIIHAALEQRDPTNKQKHFTFILVVRDKVTPSLLTAVRQATRKHNIFIQVFTLRSLFYNPTKHILVPKHLRIPRETASDIEEFNLIETQIKESLFLDSLDKLPHILDIDPIAMFIGLKPGDLCKITRPSQSAGYHVLYRLCVQNENI